MMCVDCRHTCKYAAWVWVCGVLPARNIARNTSSCVCFINKPMNQCTFIQNAFALLGISRGEEYCI